MTKKLTTTAKYERVYFSAFEGMVTIWEHAGRGEPIGWLAGAGNPEHAAACLRDTFAPGAVLHTAGTQASADWTVTLGKREAEKRKLARQRAKEIAESQHGIPIPEDIENAGRVEAVGRTWHRTSVRR